MVKSVRKIILECDRCGNTLESETTKERDQESLEIHEIAKRNNWVVKGNGNKGSECYCDCLLDFEVYESREDNLGFSLFI
jgi:hypothetical protein